MPDHRVPPQDLDSERAVIGSLLMGTADRSLPWSIDEIEAIARPAAFYDRDHTTIAGVVYAAYRAGEPIDWTTIIPKLKTGGPCDSADGDWERLTVQLAESVPDRVNAPFYARQVRRCWQHRELIRAGLELVNRGYEAAELDDPGDIIADHLRTIEAIEQAASVDREAIAEAELIGGLVNPLDRFEDLIPVPCGELAHILGNGLERGSMTVIGGRPSAGKTALGLGFGVHAVRSTDGCPALFVSVEMTAEQIGQRLISMRSGVSMRRIRSGDVPTDEFNRARNKSVLDAREGQTLYVLEGVTDVNAICAQARRYVRSKSVGLIVVDYLGLLRIGGKFDRHDLRIGAMSSAFKRLALESKAAVIVLVQLNRSGEKEQRRPRISDLRDSGLIEADADNIILIHKGRQEGGELAETTLIVAKQRQGETGDAQVWFNKGTMNYVARSYGLDPA